MAETYNDLYLNTRRKLREAGIESGQLEARLMVANAAGKTTTQLLADLRLYASDEVIKKVAEMTRRRLAGEPVAYLTGSWEFRGLPLEVNPSVLIPRSDTEVLAGAAISAIKNGSPSSRVLDLCAGSGCVGCSIAKEFSGCRVVCADISREALAVCRKNVLLNKLTPRVTCLEADALKAPPVGIGTFDVLVCNPPYVPTAEIMALDSSVRDYEPKAALDGGPDGLDFYRAILKRWKCVLREGGRLLFEVGDGQALPVTELMDSAGIEDIACINDTAGIERVVSGKI